MTGEQKGGLTLLEVMVAIGLLAVATLSLLTVFVGGLRMMQRSNEMAAANGVAKSTLEAIDRDFRAFGLASLDAGVYIYDGRTPDPTTATGTNTFPPAPYPSVVVGDQRYFVVVEGRPEGTRLRRVRVSVYWNDNHPLKLETLLHP